MSRANASKSGMDMWPGVYWLKSSSSHASLADTDIVCGGGGGGGGEGGGWRELCDVAGGGSYLAQALPVTYLKIPGAPAKNTQQTFV